MLDDISIERVAEETLDLWVTLRSELWPEGSDAEHRAFASACLERPDGPGGFLALDKGGGGLGFAEVSLRFDYVNGATTTPVAFLEGLYVRAGARRQGIARHLVMAIERWAQQQGCTELASDAEIANHGSHQTHGALGFTETERVVFFLKRIDLPTAQ